MTKTSQSTVIQFYMGLPDYTYMCIINIHCITQEILQKLLAKYTRTTHHSQQMKRALVTQPIDYALSNSPKSIVHVSLTWETKQAQWTITLIRISPFGNSCNTAFSRNHGHGFMLHWPLQTTSFFMLRGAHKTFRHMNKKQYRSKREKQAFSEGARWRFL